MEKYYHNTLFLDKIFDKENIVVINKAALPFRLSLILLNRPIDKDVFLPLYNYASFIVLWDGASNRLYNLFEDSERDRYLPTHIVGDLDSSKPEVIKYYEDRGVKILQDKEDQDTNDFQKSIKWITNCLASNPFYSHDENKDSIEHQNVEKVVVLNPFGGRIDQTISSMHTLCGSSELLKGSESDENNHGVDFILMDSFSIMQCLLPGINYIRPATTIESFKGCGVIPLMGKWNHIKTKGLKWNMGNSDNEFWSLEFGSGIISTSNEFTEEEIEIIVSEPVVWTTTLKDYYTFDD